jgi:N-dimethylarginine dimethylaminohydrolase
MKHINQHVLVSDAQNFSIEQPINPYYGLGGLDKQLALNEHTSVLECFKKAGINITQVASPSDSQDGIYTANWALVRGEKAILARLPNARKTEEDYAEHILNDLGKTVFRVPSNYKFSGQGDSLPCGQYLLAGSGYRSDVEAQEFAAEMLGLELIQLQAIPYRDQNGNPVINKVTGWPDSFFYDIDLAIAVINDNLIAYCPEAFTSKSLDKIRSLELEKIEVSLEEAENGFACNLVSTGETVIMSAHAPSLQKELESRGIKVLTTEIKELAKGGGYIRCVSLTLD